MSDKSKKKYDVITVGDCVLDCISYVNRMPKMGETMAALNFFATPGGKGANACTAGARLGSTNVFICKIGNDMFGKNFLTTLAKDNINTDHVSFTDSSPTSVASIMVDAEGNNAIVVNFGATLELSQKDLENAEEAIRSSKVLVTSRVINESTALLALKLAKKHNLITIFNFAPATKDLNEDFNKYVDILVVNEVEAEVFTNSTVKTVQDAIEASNIVLSREGFHIGVIVTLGELGAVYVDKQTRTHRHFQSPKVKVVDTTGAGDSFVGSLAHYIASTGIESIHRSIELACEYAAITVQFKGTQASYPFLDSLDSKFKVEYIDN